MSGHSKWSTIKRRKGAQDARRGKLFAKLIRAIEVAARQGGGDPAANPTLAAAVEKAKSNSVPQNSIERAIARGAGAAEGDAAYDELWYEGYAPGGVALYVHVLTDNRNRAASDVRATFTRNGGNLGEPGSVAYLFEPKGYIMVTGDEDEVMEAAAEAGAEDLRATKGGFEVITQPSDLGAVRAALESKGLALDIVEITQLPKATVPVDRNTAPRVLHLLDVLEDLDDVQEVYANFDIPDEVMEALR